MILLTLSSTSYLCSLYISSIFFVLLSDYYKYSNLSNPAFTCYWTHLSFMTKNSFKVTI